MRLLNTVAFELEEFFDSNTPRYAILSHTWGNEEISFFEMQNQNEAIRQKAGFKKILDFCALAKRNGFIYGWADTCCIDKRNSAELSEAINSMYRYYYNAAECLVYLEDVPPQTKGTLGEDGQLNAIKSSRWFTRGWTLQELIAPQTRYYFAGDWSPIEHSGSMNRVAADVTGINEQVLGNREMVSNFSVAQRMCWASRRQTTRCEDIAYGLMGLFNVNMPVLYGEGASKAFRRLQNEIMQTSFDQTIVAWRANSESSGLLATSPADFCNTPQLGLWYPWNLSPLVMTSVGLSARLRILEGIEGIEGTEDGVGSRSSSGAQGLIGSLAALQCDIKVGNSWKVLMVYVESVGMARFFVNGKSVKAYRRVRCAEWLPVDSERLDGLPYQDVLVLEDEHFQFLKRSIEDSHQRLGLFS
jgi:hypothetical protein